MKFASAALENIIAAHQYMRGLGRYPERGRAAPSFFGQLCNIEALDAAREHYYGHDPESLRIFDWLSRFRIVMTAYGIEAGKDLPGAPYSREEWAALEERARNMTDGVLGDDYLLDRIDTWLLEAYSLKGLCAARPGDIVLDCGAFTGSTSLYFSGLVGEAGRVYGFEPVEGIYARFARNVAGASNVTPIHAAVTERDGPVRLCDIGEASQVLSAEDADCATEMGYGLSLDNFVEKEGLERVDFIKMDVEGSEAAAIKGAARTIKKFRPRMAVSAYHLEYDLITLPQEILYLDGGYRFYLRHFSDCSFETVLFCVP